METMIVIDGHYYPTDDIVGMVIATMKTNKSHEVKVVSDDGSEETVVLIDASSQGLPLKKSRYWVEYTAEGWLDDSYCD